MPPAKALQQRTEHYRRRGWSEGRIKRAIESKIAAEARQTRKGATEGAANWIEVMTVTCNGLSIPQLGLMVQNYRRGPGCDDFLARREVFGRIDDAAGHLGKMRSGVIYDFALDGPFA